MAMGVDTETACKALKFIATGAASTFAASGTYSRLTDFPVFLELDLKAALQTVRIKFQTARAMQAPLAGVTGMCGIGIYALDRDKGLPWLIGGGAMWGLGVYTALWIYPGPLKSILDPDVASKKEEAAIREDIKWFRKLHTLRVLASWGVYGLFLYELIFAK